MRPREHRRPAGEFLSFIPLPFILVLLGFMERKDRDRKQVQKIHKLFISLSAMK
jgi:hypothetical protein